MTISAKYSPPFTTHVAAPINGYRHLLTPETLASLESFESQERARTEAKIDKQKARASKHD